MLTVFSNAHRGHHGQGEMAGGRLLPVVEQPARADVVLRAVRERALGEVEEAEDHGLEPILTVHQKRYVDFLRTAYEEWSALYPASDALPLIWPARGLRQVEPTSVEGKIGFYVGDAGTPITAGTWDAAYGAAQVAVTGARRLDGARRTVFALCRPPGHHASGDLANGYCFFNNAAIAAHGIRLRGAKRIAILDVDYHHGNGTQALFYDDPMVLVVSIHADPAHEYPFFSGYADETGIGPGAGANMNVPLPAGTVWEAYADALGRALDRIEAFGPDAVVVSFGADTYEGDPIAHFKLTTDDFARLGEAVGKLRRPMLVVMEGGYALDALGQNTTAMLAALAAGPA